MDMCKLYCMNVYVSCTYMGVYSLYSVDVYIQTLTHTLHIYVICLNMGIYSLRIYTWVSTDREYKCINLLFTGDPVPRDVHLCVPCLSIFPLKGHAQPISNSTT